MMNMGHVFATRARLQQIERDNTLNLCHYGLESVRSLYPSLTGAYLRSAGDLAREVWDSGLDIRAGNHYFMRWAASHNDFPLARELYLLGGDPGACSGFATRYFSFHGNLHAVRWLHGLGHAARHRNDGITYAAGNGHIPVMDFLESLGPLQPPPARALFTAVRAAKLDAAQWLAARGTDPRTENDIIMFHAMASASIPVLEWVKEKGVNLRAFNDFGQIHAAWSGNTAVFDWFEANGIALKADLIANIAADKGHTGLLQWAHDRGGIIAPHAERSGLALSAANNDPRLKALIMEQRESKSAALVNTAIRETLSPPPLTTRLWRLIRS